MLRSNEDYREISVHETVYLLTFTSKSLQLALDWCQTVATVRYGDQPLPEGLHQVPFSLAHTLSALKTGKCAAYSDLTAYDSPTFAKEAVSREDLHIQERLHDSIFRYLRTAQYDKVSEERILAKDHQYEQARELLTNVGSSVHAIALLDILSMKIENVSLMRATNWTISLDTVR